MACQRCHLGRRKCDRTEDSGPCRACVVAKVDCLPHVDGRHYSRCDRCRRGTSKEKCIVETDAYDCTQCLESRHPCTWNDRNERLEKDRRHKGKQRINEGSSNDRPSGSTNKRPRGRPSDASQGHQNGAPASDADARAGEGRLGASPVPHFHFEEGAPRRAGWSTARATGGTVTLSDRPEWKMLVEGLENDMSHYGGSQSRRRIQVEGIGDQPSCGKRIYEIPPEKFWIANLCHKNARDHPRPDAEPVVGLSRYAAPLYWLKSRGPWSRLPGNDVQEEEPEEVVLARQRHDDQPDSHGAYFHDLTPAPLGARAADGELSEWVVAVRKETWFEVVADVTLDQPGRFVVEFLFLIVPTEILPDADELVRHETTLRDGWHLPRYEELRTLQGINLRAGQPETWEEYTRDWVYYDKLSLGKVKNTKESQAAWGCITDGGIGTSEEKPVASARDEAKKAACKTGGRLGWTLWQCRNVLVVPEEERRVRILAFSGSNPRRDGHGDYWLPRGRFLFGGARLREVVDGDDDDEDGGDGVP